MSRYKAYPEYRNTSIQWASRTPKHWKCAKLKWSFQEKKAVINPNLPAGSISFGQVVFKNKDSQFSDTIATYQELLPSEFIVNPLNLNYDLKSLRIALSNTAVRVSPGYIVMQHTAGGSNRFWRWLFYVFDVKHMKTLGAGIRQTVSFSDIGNCYFAIPHINEQVSIADYIDSKTTRIDTLLEKKIRFIELLKEKRQAMITHAVTKGLDPDVPMKDSGVEWIGEVPHHWESTKLGYAATHAGGKTPNKDEPGYWRGDVPWVSPKDMKTNIIENSQEKITDEAVRECHMTMFPPGTILVVVRGMILAHSFPVAETSVSVTINQDMKALSPRSDVSTTFLRLLLENSRQFVVTRLVAEATHGTRVLRTEEWRRLSLFLPPLNEQAEIVEEVAISSSRIDTLIEKTERSIELLKEKRSALITAAVTGKIDVREHQTEAA